MFAMVGAIFIASLLGSFHCAGMCGAFLAVASGGNRGARRQATLQGAYHLGRLTTYTLLGAAAGAAGRFLDLASALAGLRPMAAVLAGGVMVIFGLMAFAKARGARLRQLPLPAGWLRIVQAGHRAAMSLPPVYRAGAIGMLTTLLPCGWLYAFAMTAAATGSPVRGALVMGVFWLGTLPMMISLGAGLGALLGPIGAKLPVITSMAVVAVGLYTLSSRTLLDPMAMAAPVPTPHQTIATTDASLNIPSPAAHHSCCTKP